MELLVLIVIIWVMAKTTWISDSFSNDWYLPKMTLEEKMRKFEDFEIDWAEEKRLREMSDEELDELTLKILMKKEEDLTPEDIDFITREY